MVLLVYTNLMAIRCLFIAYIPIFNVGINSLEEHPMNKHPQAVAIITGSSSGIGKAIAHCLSINAITVVTNSRSVIKNNELTDSINIKHIAGDITKPSDCKRLIEETMDHYGRLDVLVNNAGISMRQNNDDCLAVSNVDFLKLMDANVVSTWGLCRDAAPYLNASPNGNIINITSAAASYPKAASSALPYAIAKSAINHMTRLLASSLGPAIRVNAISPGLINTPRVKGFEKAIETFEKVSVLKKIGDPDDIAKMALSIIECSFITGEIIHVDGGVGLC